MSSLFSDELLRSLMAVGQVDVLAGLPTLDHAASVGGVVQAAHAAFEGPLARQRTLLMNVDGGSTDGTPDVVREAALGRDTFMAAQSLRTRHRISTPYHGVPGKRSALRILFAAAELLDARAVLILDPEITSVSAESVAALVAPVLAGEADFVSPAYARHPFEGALVSQLVRPLFRTAYGVPLREPLASEMACSPRFAAHCVALPEWDDEALRTVIDLWLSAVACSTPFRLAEVRLGPRRLVTKERPPIAEIVPQVLGGLCACLRLSEQAWLRRDGAPPVAVRGVPQPPADAPAPDVQALARAFKDELSALEPILSRALRPATLAALKAAAAEPQPQLPDGLWASAACEIAAGHRAAHVSREHLLRAAVPVYLGRVAAFGAECAERGPDEVERRLEALELRFDECRNTLVELWTAAMR